MKLMRYLLAMIAGTMLLLINCGSAHALADDYDYLHVSGNGASMDGYVHYLGPRSVNVAVSVKDSPGDPYCTVATAQLWGTGGQLGNTITLGSVCNGNSGALPLKPISTQAGNIYQVRVYTQRGVGGPWATDGAICFYNFDGAENCS